MNLLGWLMVAGVAYIAVVAVVLTWCAAAGRDDDLHGRPRG